MPEIVKTYCSFCGKSQDDVFYLVEGPRVYICDECLDLCQDIVDNARKEKDSECLEERKDVTKPGFI